MKNDSTICHQISRNEVISKMSEENIELSPCVCELVLVIGCFSQEFQRQPNKFEKYLK